MDRSAKFQILRPDEFFFIGILAFVLELEEEAVSENLSVLNGKASSRSAIGRTRRVVGFGILLIYPSIGIPRCWNTNSWKSRSGEMSTKGISQAADDQNAVCEWTISPSDVISSLIDRMYKRGDRDRRNRQFRVISDLPSPWTSCMEVDVIIFVHFWRQYLRRSFSSQCNDVISRTGYSGLHFPINCANRYRLCS